ncbi:GWxTD domain-containing protein, partial [Vicingaceae bacterium]|nr:GWxTD domain-containing protein [Vicingaceae bacterium]
ENGPFIETYLSVVGSSAIYKKTLENTFQSKIEVTLIFKQGEEIIKYKKYNLSSPVINDSLAVRDNFIDQQRISLPDGKYEFEVSIKDINSEKEPFKSTQILEIDYPTTEIRVSDIELVESLKKTSEKTVLSKNGYDILPYTSDFYPEDFEKIAFYAEIYNADKAVGINEPFLLSYYIETSENNKIINSYRSFSREVGKPVNILLKSFSIVDLPSGNYNLAVEVRDKKNKLLTTKKIFFQRSNPKSTPLLLSNDYLSTFVDSLDKKQLSESLKSIEPISTTVEINFAENQLKGEDEAMMKQYLYNFWLTRNEMDPEMEWRNYEELVKTTNELFSTGIKKGYTTDRGRIYLKYGKPNTRSQIKSEPSSYPYEIWHYHKVKGFSNKRFVFFSRDLVTNEYPLLHSDMPGHIFNAQWRVQLHKRTNQPLDMDEENNDGHYGGRANDYFNNPR